MSESDPHAWTDEERQRAKEPLNSDARSVASTGGPNPERVSPMQCQDWRRQLKTSMDATPYTLQDESAFARTTIENHVRGDCNHDSDVVGVAVRYSEVADTWVSDYGDE